MERVINLTEVPLETREGGRAGLVRSQSVLDGSEGTPQHYSLRLAHTREDFSKPRQQHPFHQVRLQLKGVADFAADGILRAGHIAFIPAGVPYGPQTVAGDSATLLLRFGENEDALEAEPALSGFAEMPSPEAPYVVSPDDTDGGPVFLDPERVAWSDDPVVAGVRRKSLGHFVEQQLRIDMIALPEGTAVQLAPHSFLFALSGAGRVTGNSWYQHAIIRTDDQPGHLSATQESLLLQLQLPPG
jgi:hypothetical protein